MRKNFLVVFKEKSMRPFYLHRRQGVWYAELVDQATGKKLNARSTETTDRDQAVMKVALWLKTGVPTSRKGKPRPVEEAVGTQSILRAVKNTDLNGNDAIKIVNVLKERGLVDVSIVKAGQGSILFTDFLRQFWNYVDSPYVREKKSYGHNLGRRHCYEMQSRIGSFYDDYFTDRPLGSITRQDLKSFSMFLTDQREKPIGFKGKFVEKLSPGYINKILKCSTTALAWAYKEGRISDDPTAGLLKFSETPKKRGVLTP